MTTALFTPIRLRQITLANRIVVAPMCQYCAADGNANDWHLVHYGGLAVSGSGLVIVEATAVLPGGRITPNCLGLYCDENERALARVLGFCRDYGNVTVGIQLAHAGRKASVRPPWHDRRPLTNAEGGWPTVAPSALPFVPDGPVPEELDAAGLETIRDGFVAAARRADRLDIALVEIHAAHGYLLHQFLSPISNRRTDAYGGSLENRIRFPVEVFKVVRDAWPSHKPLGIRVSAADYVDGGWDVDDTMALVRALEGSGCDYIHVSGGGISPDAGDPAGPGCQLHLAQQVKTATAMPVIAVKEITDAVQAETVIASGQADMVALGRAMLFNPHWTWQAAVQLDGQTAYPPQYERAHPSFQGRRVPDVPPAPKV